MQIREITPADAAEIGRLYAQSAAYLRSLGDDTDFQFNAKIFLRDGFGENRAFWGIAVQSLRAAEVAEEAGQLLGYCLYNFTYDTDRALRILYVLDLLVDESARGKGIGMRLMHAAEAIAREKNCSELQWAVYAPNKAALDFYHKFGGELIDDLLYMRKSL